MLLVFTADDGVHGRELWETDGTAAGTVLLADINPGAGDSDPTDFVTMGGIDYFSAFDGTSNELWRTDGTAAGAYALSTTANGAAPTMITRVGAQLFYEGSDSTHGAGLFVSDGTASTTSFLAPVTGAGNFTALGDDLLFTASDSTHGTELWLSDGTVAGTHILADIDPGAASSYPSSLTLYDGKVYFAAYDGVHGTELWSTDGAAAGTAMVAPAGVGGASPTNLVVANGLLFFVADDTSGPELWATNGTAAGTVQLTHGGDYDLNDTPYQVAGGHLYFEGNVPGSNYGGLYVTDGTVAGTSLVADVSYVATVTQVAGNLVFSGYTPGAEDGLYVSNGTPAGTSLVAGGQISGAVTVAGGTAYFYFLPSAGVGTQLWTSDGTVAGTRLVEDFTPGVTTTGATDITAFGNDFLFGASTDQLNKELWISDGTAAGTQEVLNINPPSPAGSLAIQEGLVSTGVFAPLATVLGTALVFAADVDGWEGPYLYASDGTAAGTVQLATLSPGETLADIADFMSVGGMLFFIANDGADSDQLWMTEGVAGDAVMLTGAFNGFLTTGSSTPAFLTSFDGKLYFSDYDSTHAGSLYVSDGTVAGTQFVTSISVENQPVVLNGEMVFLGDTQANGQGFYASDGTAAGTVFLGPGGGGDGTGISVSDLASGGPGRTSSDGVDATTTGSGSIIVVGVGAGVGVGTTPFPSFVVSGSQAFISLDTTTQGQELWVTDGTAAGTHIVDDIAPGAASSDPSDLTAFDGGVIFTADDIIHGAQVWFSDGTLAGTYSLDINTTTNPAASLNLDPGSAGVAPAAVLFDGMAFFVASDGIDGEALWYSDGTADGTGLLQTTVPALAGVGAGELMLFNDEIFFQDSAGTPWVTDGTAAGTVHLSSTIGQITNPVAVGDEMYFSAVTNPSQGVFDYGLFVTDGAVGGTQEVFNYETTGLIAAGDNLFFLANDPAHGYGLYAYDVLTKATTFLSSVGVIEPTAAPIGVSLGSEVIFAGGDGVHGVEPWASDGAVGGTLMLADIDPGSNGSYPTDFTTSNGLVYFVTGTNDNSLPLAPNIWVTDGTSGGTTALLSISNASISDISLLTPDGSNLYFVETHFSTPQDLWDYNTGSGTVSLIQTIYDGGDGAFVANPLVANGVLYFQSVDPLTGVVELWRANPAGGATMLTNTANGANAAQFTVVGNDLFFTGDDTVHGQGLFVTDGATVTFLTAISTLAAGTAFDAIGNELYFQNSDPVNGSELWVSDGTVAGTHRVTDTESPNSANASGYTVADGQVFFSATDGVHGQELWVFDGTPGGARMVEDLNPGSASANPTSLTAFHGLLFFVAASGANTELWSTDGAAADTDVITSLTNGGTPQLLTVVGDKLFFYGSDSVHGAGLFVSDGTAAGTTFLEAFSLASSFVAVGSELYFQGYDPVNGEELWKSDGTTAGTVRVTDTYIDSGSYPELLTPVGGSDTLVAGPGDQTLIAGAGSQTLIGGAGHDTFIAGSGSDTLTGGSGFNVAVFDIDAAGASLTHNPDNSWTVDLGSGVVDTLTDIQVLQFADGDVSLVADWTNRGDFLGDSRSDFLIENSVGAVAVGEVANGQAGYTEVAGLGPEWTFHGAGDFLGSGQSAFLIENTVGAVDIGEVVGGQAQYTQVAALGPEWSFVGTGDFLGDGKSDFLIENTAGAVVVGEVVGGAAQYTQVAGLGPEWKFVGSGDFLGDGKSDFLIENAVGAVVVGEVVNGAAQYTQVAALGPEWTFEGAGDFLGDGKSDFLIENAAGAVYVGEVANGAAQYTQIAGLGPEWSFRGVGDYLGEGHDQFLIENAAGAVVVGDWTGGAIHYTEVAALGAEWAFH